MILIDSFFSEELTHEREKFKAISEELEHTMNEVAEY